MIIKNTFSPDNKSFTLETIKHNNFMLGISINNKYFTKDTIHKFTDWMLKNTDGKVCIMIVDTIQAINNEVLNHQSKEKALDKAMKDAKNIEHRCKSVIDNYSKIERNRLVIIRWTEINTDSVYINNLKIIKNEFNQNPKFKEFIIYFVKKQLGDITNRLNMDEITYISDYLLCEIPELLNGISYNNTTYDVCIYPGSFKELMLGICTFEKLMLKLKIQNKNKFIEIYVD